MFLGYQAMPVLDHTSTPTWALPPGHVVRLIAHKVDDLWVGQCVDFDITTDKTKYLGEVGNLLVAKLRDLVEAKLNEGWSTRFAAGLSWLKRSDSKLEKVWDASSMGEHTLWEFYLHQGPYSRMQYQIRVPSGRTEICDPRSSATSRSRRWVRIETKSSRT
jgi:hypothetical protein